MIDDLLSRASVTDFSDPGPDDDELRLILAAAVRAPDHGKLRPWQFFVIRGEARNELSELFGDALVRRDQDATEKQIAKEKTKPLRSPVTIAVIAKVIPEHKIPVLEQVVSAAAAAMNIVNAVHALGFGAKWVTGANCYDPYFLSEFGVRAPDQLLGFIHIGSLNTVPETARPDAAEFTTEWQRVRQDR
jgi:nitroreductase